MVASGGRLRFAHAITHLLRYRLGHFVNSNKWNTHKKNWSNFLLGSQKISSFTNLPSCKHHCISGGWRPFKHAWLNTEINMYKLLYRYFPITKSYKLQPMCKWKYINYCKPQDTCNNYLFVFDVISSVCLRNGYVTVLKSVSHILLLITVRLCWTR